MTAGRADSLLQAAGLKETVLGSLERGDSLFVLTDDTLLFQDSGGMRRVTLRDLRRIHSDESGLLRVETPAGTALTSSLLGFDPAAVQSFFRQVKEATAKAKERAGTTTIITEPAPVPRQAAAAPATPTPVAPAVSAQPATPAPAATWTQPANPAPVPPRTAGGSASPTPTAPATPTQAAFKPAGAVMAQPAAQPTQPSPVPPPVTPRPAAAPLGTPAVTTPLPPVNPVQATPPAAAPAAGPSRPVAPVEARVPAPETPKATVKAVRTPTVITDPAVAGPEEKFTATPARSGLDSRAAEKAAETSASTLAPVVAERPAVSAARVALPGGAASALAALAAVAGGVGAWAGRLKFLSVVMLVAALALAYLQFNNGQGLSGVWVLIAGGMSAVGLWALGDVTRLLVSLAQAVSAEGGVMDVD